MPLVSVTHNFAPNTLAQADQVDQNFADLVAWINSNAIQKDASVAFTATPSGPSLDATADNQFIRNAFVARGVHTSAGTGGNSHTGTISFGKTFAAAPIVVATVRVTAGIDLFLQWNAAPSTTGQNYEVGTINGLGFSSTYHIYWHAYPIEP